MTKQKKNQQQTKLLSTDSALFQPIADEQAESVKGGFSYYCHIAKKIKKATSGGF